MIIVSETDNPASFNQLEAHNMEHKNENIPDPKELEKEIADFLSKKFGGNIKVVTPQFSPQAEPEGIKETKVKDIDSKINFDMKPEELIAYLDQYIVRQDEAKAVLSTKICTHFNRIRKAASNPDAVDELSGSIKNNILMLGPTGSGKTYMVKLIAQKLGVPFVKGDATKFSETGYVGGDVEDLVRDLVREANDDIALAEHGIIYIDEIDKIASSRNLIGADVSRTGVQRALLKPMEETDVELKVPHDPVSMLQELDRFQKTGKKNKRTVNTKNVLFIMSGAFGGLSEIIQKRIKGKKIGFGADIAEKESNDEILKKVRTEDLVEFGFETEFVGRLPIRTVFETLSRDDIFEILRNPNNPIILGKKLDFAAYDIDIKFEEAALDLLADEAYSENTGARGISSCVEKALLKFERKLPSTNVKFLPVTLDAIKNPDETISSLTDPQHSEKWEKIYQKLAEAEKNYAHKYVAENWKSLSLKYNLTLSEARINLVSDYYCSHMTSTGNAIKRIKNYYDDARKIELYFLNRHDINIVFEDDAVDFIIEQFVKHGATVDEVFKKMTSDFELGLKLVKEKTKRNRFFISLDALLTPEHHIENLIRNGMKEVK